MKNEKHMLHLSERGRQNYSRAQARKTIHKPSSRNSSDFQKWLLAAIHIVRHWHSNPWSRFNRSQKPIWAAHKELLQKFCKPSVISRRVLVIRVNIKILNVYADWGIVHHAFLLHSDKASEMLAFFIKSWNAVEQANPCSFLTKWKSDALGIKS